MIERGKTVLIGIILFLSFFFQNVAYSTHYDFVDRTDKGFLPQKTSRKEYLDSYAIDSNFKIINDYYVDDGRQIAQSNDNKKLRELQTPEEPLFVYNGFIGKDWSGEGYVRAPRDVCFDSKGFLYIADSGNHRIQKMNATTNEIFLTWGEYGTNDGEFINPISIAADTNNNIFVISGQRIQKFTEEGIHLSTIHTINNPHISSPIAIDVDSENYMYILDDEDDYIYKLNTTGEIICSWGGWGNNYGAFDYPTGIGIDTNDNVYIADRWNGRIQIFSSNGAFKNSYDVSLPQDVEIDANNNMIVSHGPFDDPVPFISIFNQTGHLNSTIDNGLSSAYGMALSFKNELFVADSANDSLRLINMTNSPPNVVTISDQGEADDQFYYPKSIAINKTGFIFVLDNNLGQVKVYDPQENYLFSFGGKGENNGEFEGPVIIKINESGFIYVVDQGRHNIQVFSPDGVFKNKFGSLGTGLGLLDGPTDLIFTKNGDILVSDSFNSRVQKFTATGEYLDYYDMDDMYFGHPDNHIGDPYEIEFLDEQEEILLLRGEQGKILKWNLTDTSVYDYIMPANSAINSMVIYRKNNFSYFIDGTAKKVYYNHEVILPIDTSHSFSTGCGPLNKYSSPVDLALDSTNRTVYVADQAKRVILKFCRSYLPTIDLSSHENNSVLSPKTVVRFNINDKDNDSSLNVWYKLNSTQKLLFIEKWEITTPDTEGTFFIEIEANDSYGGIVTKTFIFHIDETPPILDSISPSNNTIIFPKTMISFVINEFRIKNFTYRWENWDVGLKEVLNEPYKLLAPESEGQYKLWIKITDMVNLTLEKNFTWLINGPPQVKLEKQENKSALFRGVVLNFTIEDSTLNLVQYKWDNQNLQEFSIQWYITTPELTEGWHKFIIIANDDYGSSTKCTYEFYIIEELYITVVQDLPNIIYTGDTYIYQLQILSDKPVNIDLHLCVYSELDEISYISSGNDTTFTLYKNQQKKIITLNIEPRHASDHEINITMFFQQTIIFSSILKYNVRSIESSISLPNITSLSDYFFTISIFCMSIFVIKEKRKNRKELK